MSYDIVIPLKRSEPNEDLRFTLRALDRFGGEIGNVWIVGYCPKWLKNVRYVPTEQNADKWTNTLANRLRICQEADLSDDFVLFNDDFILTRPVEDWLVATNFHRGFLADYALELQASGVTMSRWRRGFAFNDRVLKHLGVKRPLNYEYHGPMMLNKHQFPRIYETKALEVFREPRELFFHRSIYGNLYPRDDIAEAVVIDDDPKIRTTDIKTEDYLTRFGFFSVADFVTNNRARFPRLRAWLDSHLGTPSRFENGKC